VSIRASLSKQIDALVADLGSPSAVTREAAVARLTIIGPRAVARLVAAAESAAAAASRATAFRTLEAIGDARALAPALEALADASADPSVAVAAAAVARAFVLGAHGADAVDRLTAAALDRQRPESVRLAALRALGALDRSTISPLLASLAGDPNTTVRAEARAGGGRRPRGDPAELLGRAAEGRLPDDPAGLRRALSRAGDAVALPLLLRIVERIREREGVERAGRRDEWTRARAAAHVALANRGSRLALYDLRESLDAATTPLPVEFLAALSLAGDASCLEAMAGAHARVSNAWWRQRLADAFHTIVAREKLTRRHAVVRHIEKRTPDAFRALWAGRAG
jgi:HEAT repeat protein